jgi:hypothetical protein
MAAGVCMMYYYKRICFFFLIKSYRRQVGLARLDYSVWLIACVIFRAGFTLVHSSAGALFLRTVRFF